MSASLRVSLSFALVVSTWTLTSALPSTSQAAIPEPDAVIHGMLTGPQSALIEARRSGEVLATADIQNGAYVILVRLEEPLDELQRSPQTAWIQDEVEIFVNGEATGDTIAILERGFVANRNLEVMVDQDLDDDGVLDINDNCSRTSNGDQTDSDGNGVGDACEGAINVPLIATLANVPALDPGAALPGNPADELTLLGAVDYDFMLMATEVTNIQYVNFLNAVAASDPNALFNGNMELDARGGITRSGNDGSFAYAVKPQMADKPVNFVSWLDAARFANWMHNGMPNGAQGPSTTETGTFDLQNPALAASVDRVLVGNESWSLPTEDEWYKAAYYDPEVVPPYWIYPTQSDSQPLLAFADQVGDAANPPVDAATRISNYDLGAEWNGIVGNVLSVGSTLSPSPSGHLDMGGNVSEWLGAPTEAAECAATTCRVSRGGSHLDDRFALESLAGLTRGDVLRDVAYEGADQGFRLVLVPEPLIAHLSVGALAALGFLRSLRRNRGRRR